MSTPCMILLMDIQFFWYMIIGLAGLVFGSFAGASVWRLRARQLVEDKKLGHPYSKKEYERLLKLTKNGVTSDRSRCLACNHVLEWYDLIPIVSWAWAKGKCRYCKKPIGWFEPAIEVLTAGLFVGVYHSLSNNGSGIEALLLMLAITVGMMILFFYDLKWLLLPNVVMWVVIALSAIWWVRLALLSADAGVLSIATGWSLVILPGLYLALWLISKGQWVGFGDIKLGLALALLLADWRLALLTLFLANLIGTIIVIPGILSKKLGRQSQVPFGPLLIAGFFIAFLYGGGLVNWYMGLMNGFVV